MSFYVSVRHSNNDIMKSIANTTCRLLNRLQEINV